MAIPTVCRRFRQFGPNSFLTSKFKEFIALNAADSAIRYKFITYTQNRSCSSSAPSNQRYASRYLDNKHLSQLLDSNGNRLFLVDTLALLRRLEAQELSSKQAEAITGVISEVLQESLDNVAYSFMSKSEMQKFVMIQESNLAMFQSETQNSQEHQFSMSRRDTEKLQSEVDKMQSDLKHEIDKVAAGLRLDLNLEKGKIRDELAKQSSETSYLTNELDKELQAFKAQLEGAKYEMMKYCVGTLFSICAIGIAVVRVSL